MAFMAERRRSNQSMEEQKVLASDRGPKYLSQTRRRMQKARGRTHTHTHNKQREPTFRGETRGRGLLSSFSLHLPLTRSVSLLLSSPMIGLTRRRTARPS